jgi:RNA polymerase sigma factor (TIGR02999 family)
MDHLPADSAIDSLLARWRQGDLHASEELIALLYRELRGLAALRLRRSPGHSLAPTELVHEAFMKLARSPNHTWQDRCHFINAAGTAMRSILVDRARAKRSLKRTRPHIATEVDSTLASLDEDRDPDSVLRINQAIAALEHQDPRSAQVVTLRFFAGLTEPEIAQVLDVHERTVRRDWLYARAWLKRYLDQDPSNPGENPGEDPR